MRTSEPSSRGWSPSIARLAKELPRLTQRFPPRAPRWGSDEVVSIRLTVRLAHQVAPTMPTRARASLHRATIVTRCTSRRSLHVSNAWATDRLPATRTGSSPDRRLCHAWHAEHLLSSSYLGYYIRPMTLYRPTHDVTPSNQCQDQAMQCGVT